MGVARICLPRGIRRGEALVELGVSSAKSFPSGSHSRQESQSALINYKDSKRKVTPSFNAFLIALPIDIRQFKVLCLE